MADGTPRHAVGPVEHNVQYLRQLIHGRVVRRRSAQRRGLLVVVAFGVPTVLVAIPGLVASLPSFTTRGQVVLLALLLAAFGLAARFEFETTTGFTSTAQPMFVAVLLCLPIWSVPAVVLVAELLSTRRDRWGPGWIGHFLRVGSWSFYCLGPVAVLALLAGVEYGREAPWYVFLLAWLTQFPLDSAAAAARAWASDTPLSRLFGNLRWAYVVEALLGALGWSATTAAGYPPRPVVLLALLSVPVLLVAVLERDRSRHITAAISVEQAYEAAERQARLDSLTGLANRRGWDEAIAEARRTIEADGVGVGAVVVMADVDGLKPVNDRFGHAAGDVLIITAARVLSRAAPSAHVVARIGGDEFGILLLCPTDEVTDVVAGLGREIPLLARQAEPVHGHPVSMSIGVHGCPPAGDLLDALAAADLAARAEKASRRPGRA